MTEKAQGTPPAIGGFTPDGSVWTGEVQALDFADTATAATAITVPGRWFRFYATAGCCVNIGDANIQTATTALQDSCWPIPSGVTTAPIYIPTSFDSAGDGTGTLYISAIRSGASDGTLYICQCYPSSDTRTTGLQSTTTTTTT